MTELLAYHHDDRDADVVARAAASLGRTLHLVPDVRVLPQGPGAAEEVLEALARPGVRLGVLPYRPGAVAREDVRVISATPTPVVLVPVERCTWTAPVVSRLLVPLDGSDESAQTVAGAVEVFAASGADILVLHVFDETTVPRFWDQPAHARRSWDEEFLARYCDSPDARLEVRSGSPGETILDVAASEHPDLIALGWAQDLSPGRARTVRTMVDQSCIPILLVPLRPDRGSVRRPAAAGSGGRR